MVVRVVDIDRMAVLESKSHPPIARYRHRIIPAQIAFQWMQLKPREVHIRRAQAVVKRGEDVSQFRNVLRRQPPRLALFVKGLESTMLKRLIHRLRLFIASTLLRPPCFIGSIAGPR